MAIEYVKGQFTIDCLATIPFDTIAAFFITSKDNNTTSTFFKLLGSLKLIRILRLNKIITFLKTDEDSKAMLKLGKLVFMLILYLHIYGCCWWLIVKN